MSDNRPKMTGRSLAKLIKTAPSGVITRQNLNDRWRDVARAIRQARKRESIGIHNEFIYDPERLDTQAALQLISEGMASLPDFVAMARGALLESGQLALYESDLENRIGGFFEMGILHEDELESGGVLCLELKLFQPYKNWYYLVESDFEAVYNFALSQAEKRFDQEWENICEWAGDELRIGAQEGDTARMKALARLYTRGQIDTLLDMPDRVFKLALRKDLLPRMDCPDGSKRMRAKDVHRLHQDPALRQSLEDALEINIWQIRTVTDLKISYLRTLFHNAQIKYSSRSRDNGNGAYATVWYYWGDVRKVLWPQGDHPSMSDLEIIENTGGAGRQAWWSERIFQIHEEILEKQRQQRESKDRRRRERHEKREALRAQMIDNFPSWLREEDIDQVAYIHVGPTNSGKTHDAIQELANAGSGWYLAPLRLLAREMFERLNRMGAYCNLVTGEERIIVPGATITAATVEMFNAERSGQCVVLDEAHMVGDSQRGWAWTQALVNARAPQLHVITAPQGLSLLTRFCEAIGTETQVLYHDRLVPLDVAEKPWGLRELPARTILIAFTRQDVLRLKFELQQMGRSVAVVYGALPPEVRIKQAQRFEQGEVEICVATDAVGMGLNLPADHVVFSDVVKFDGRAQRTLTAGELQQIAGRAGRFGLSDKGFVGGIDKFTLDTVRRLMAKTVPDIEIARLAPRTDEIELLEGDLSQRLLTWKQLNAIPDALRGLVTSTELDDQIELATFLSYNDVAKLGVDAALVLVSAPVRRESQEYWLECATCILRDEPLPLPPPPPTVIMEGKSLKDAENVIACIDIYLWLGYREYFRHLVGEPQPIIDLRGELTREIDIALMRRFDPNAVVKRSRTKAYWYDE